MTRCAGEDRRVWGPEMERTNLFFRPCGGVQQLFQLAVHRALQLLPHHFLELSHPPFCVSFLQTWTGQSGRRGWAWAIHTNTPRFSQVNNTTRLLYLPVRLLSCCTPISFQTSKDTELKSHSVKNTSGAKIIYRWPHICHADKRTQTNGSGWHCADL